MNKKNFQMISNCNSKAKQKTVHQNAYSAEFKNTIIYTNFVLKRLERHALWSISDQWNLIYLLYT